MNNGHNVRSRKGKKKTRKGGKKQESMDVLNPSAPYRLATSVNALRLTYANPRRLMPFPPRFRTIMTTSTKGYVSSGTGQLLWYCRMNGVNLPFSGGGWNNGLPAIATLQPTGLKSVWNTDLYNRYRVISSRITLVLSPQATADTTLVTITPSVFANSPSTNYSALAQPLTVHKTVSANTAPGARTLINRVSTSQLLGVRSQAIEDDLSGQFIGNIISGSAVDPVAMHYWIVNFYTEDGTVYGGNIVFDCQLEHEVEFFGDDSGSVVEVPLVTPPSAASLLQQYMKARDLELKK